LAAELNRPSRAAAAPGAHVSSRHAGVLTFARLKRASLAHSAIYVALLVSAFAAGKPEPLTFALGLAHGLLWIAMSLACLTAARLRVIPLRVGVAVAVLGGVGPFFGSLEFIREERRRERERGPRDGAQPLGAPR
jgi:hypothetical protein